MSRLPSPVTIMPPSIYHLLCPVVLFLEHIKLALVMYQLYPIVKSRLMILSLGHVTPARQISNTSHQSLWKHVHLPRNPLATLALSKLSLSSSTYHVVICDQKHQDVAHVRVGIPGLSLIYCQKCFQLIASESDMVRDSDNASNFNMDWSATPSPKPQITYKCTSAEDTFQRDLLQVCLECNTLCQTLPAHTDIRPNVSERTTAHQKD